MSAEALRQVLTTWANPPESMVDKLPKPTKRGNEPGKCKECGGWHGLPAVHLDYMGHAAVTRALIEVDPEWTWEPIAFNGDGEPLVKNAGNHLRIWGRMTVLGKTLVCVGTCDANKPEPEKELIGDLLRNGAMRFGIGLALWAKDEWSDLDTPTEPVERKMQIADLTDATWYRLVSAGAGLTAEQRAALNAWLTGKKLSLKRGDLDEGTALEVIEWIGRRS